MKCCVAVLPAFCRFISIIIINVVVICLAAPIQPSNTVKPYTPTFHWFKAFNTQHGTNVPIFLFAIPTPDTGYKNIYHFLNSENFNNGYNFLISKWLYFIFLLRLFRAILIVRLLNEKHTCHTESFF